MAWVKNNDLVFAHDRWKEVWPCPLVCDWGTFLGEKYIPALSKSRYTNNNDFEWDVGPKAAERVKMIITSPHYKAILKAMAVQYVESIL